MSLKGQLTAIVRQRALAEKNAIREKTRILEILDQRQNELDNLNKTRKQLEKQCLELSTTVRRKALISGNTSALLNSQNLLSEKKKELRLLEERISAQAMATNRAKNRLDSSNQELINARMEKKKVETIEKNREVRREIKDQIQEQEDFEDIFGSKK